MAPKTNAGKLPKDLKESARKIWLAGLGALAVAEDQGAKVFQSLVERGEDFETRSEKQLGKVKDQVKNVAGKAEAQWDRIEKFVDDKVSAAVKKLGIPGRDEVKILTRRVEDLTKKVEQLKPKAEKPVKAAKPEKPAKEAKPSAAKAASKTAGKSATKVA